MILMLNSLVPMVGFIFLYYLMAERYRVWILLAASVTFIAFLSVTVALFSTLFAVMNFALGNVLQSAFINNKKSRPTLFWLSIFLNVGILAFFKYFHFFTGDLSTGIFASGIYSEIPYGHVMVPLGISYYTFQSLGYLIRINRGSEAAEKKFEVFATYLLFFPKFLSGPVARTNHLLPQLHAPEKFKQTNLEAGSRLVVWGLFKKLVIADNLYGPVNEVYSNMADYSGLPLLIVFMVQIIYIYCDFSGYTDIALGLAKIFGINLVDNFNRPLLARNISEFWRRWHISLSSWCNDFIYNPFIVKYRQFGNTAVVAGIFLTFFIVGIWHGANWTFVVLGLLQGVAIVYEFKTKKYRLKFAARYSKSLVNFISRLLVFLFMTFSMIFFFSDSLTDAWYFITHMFSGIKSGEATLDFIQDKTRFFSALVIFALLFIIQMKNEKGKNLPAAFLSQHIAIRWVGYALCMLMIILFYNGTYPFYYMRF